MKRLYILIAVAAAFASCHKDIPAGQTDQRRAVQFSASTSATTRVSYTDEEQVIRVAWKAGDKIGIHAISGGTAIATNSCYEASNSAASSPLSPVAGAIEWVDGTAIHDFYAYYPYSATAGAINGVAVSVPAAQTQYTGGDMTHLNEYDFMWASSVGKTESDGAIGFAFEHLFSVLAVEITADKGLAKVGSLTLSCTDPTEPLAFAGTFDLATEKLTVTNSSKASAITLSFASPLAVRQQAMTAYILVSGGHAGKTLQLTASVDGTPSEVLWSGVVPAEGLPSGVRTTIAVTVKGTETEQSGAIDLSAAGTANTYIVNTAGQTYKFRANIKGNGTARTYEWTVDGAPKSAGYTESDLTITPTSASVVWYNSPKGPSGWSTASPITLESVELQSDGYIYFTTPDNFVNGNVLVAVFDSAGEVLWSWNIWASEGYDPDAQGKTVGRYTMMDRNLGAVRGKEIMDNTDSRVAAAAIGNYYQWGRKDPFPAAADAAAGETADAEMAWGVPTYTPIEELKHDLSSISWGTTDMMFSNSLSENAYPLGANLSPDFTMEQAVAASVKYPYKWMSNGTDNNNISPYMWLARNETKPATEQNRWHYLWGSIDGITNTKTIYDPCPVGWKVPTVDVYGYALDRVVASTGGYGAYSSKYDLYFPFAGQRQAAFGGGKISSVGREVYLASATAAGPYYPLRGNKSGVTGNSFTGGNSYVGQGVQVRCVKEEVATQMEPVGKQDGPVAVLMGNSITEQWPIRGRKEFFTENNYIGKGISGQTSLDMISRFYNDVLSYDPRCIVITAGTNDLADNGGYRTSIEDILANVRVMARLSRDLGAEVVIGAVCPTNDMWWKDATWKAEYNPLVAGRIIALNVLLKEFAAANGFRFADYHTALKDDTDNLKLEYSWAANDRVHPNAAGYTVMEPILKTAITNALTVEGQVDTEDDQIKDLDKWEDWD
jgi:lysophospholipase L1-like esterase